MKSWFIILLLVFLAACQTTLVADSENDITSTDVLLKAIPANEIRFFGVAQGDTREHLLEMMGEPQRKDTYDGYDVENFHYNLGENSTVILYHLKNNVVDSVLLLPRISHYSNTSLNFTRRDMYARYGNPQKQEDVIEQRVYHYDKLGYKFFVGGDRILRVSLTQPNQGITGPEIQKSGEVCAQVLTPAISDEDGECIVFPNPCIVPTGWTITNSCDE